MSIIFLVRGLILVWMPATSFLIILVIIPLMGMWLVLWWPKTALDIEQGLLFALWLSQPCLGQDLLLSCWSRNPQICFWAVLWVRLYWSTPTGRGATEYSSTRVVYRRVSSVVWPVTHCGGSQSTLLLASQSALPQLWECRQTALVSLRCCVHKATSTDQPVQTHWSQVPGPQ